ncbi:MAG: hypothetical protein WC533_04370 [Candidatus Pacearchaeota archaeon]
MRKSFVLLLVAVLLCAFIANSISSVGAVAYRDIEDVADEVEKYTDPDEVKWAIEDKWDSFLDNSSFGRFLLGISNFFEYLSPVFNFIFGVEYSLSWIFFLSIAIWICFFIIVAYGLKNGFQIYSWISILAGFIVAFILAQFDLMKKIAESLSPYLTSNLKVIILIAVLVALMYAYILFMNELGRTLRHKYKREKEKLREMKAKAVEQIHDVELKSRGV